MYFKKENILKTNSNFCFSDLNMEPYCSSTTESSQSRYDLFGIINHRGSAWFGHYTSFARLVAYNDSAKTEIGKRIFDINKKKQQPFSFRLEKF